jgi:dihydroflavonol-4-reductase
MTIKALVTGGTGFLGANLVAGLNDLGVDARVLKRASSSLLALDGLSYEAVEGDILDEPDDLARLMEDVDWVFHVAAVSDYWRQNTEWLYKVNVEGTKNVLEAAKMAGVKRVVFTGSGSALGLPVGDEVLTEESQFNLKPKEWPYAHSKHLAELEVRRATDEGLACVTLLPTIAIGPRDLNLISGTFIIETARGLAKVYPPGGTNYVDVAQVVAGHIAAAELGQVGQRYILGGQNLTHREAVEIACEIVGRPAPRVGLPRWSLGPLAAVVTVARAIFGNRILFEARHVRLSGVNLYFDPSKAVQELGLKITPFRQAAKNAFDWYNENGFLTE